MPSICSELVFWNYASSRYVYKLLLANTTNSHRSHTWVERIIYMGSKRMSNAFAARHRSGYIVKYIDIQKYGVVHLFTNTFSLNAIIFNFKALKKLFFRIGCVFLNDNYESIFGCRIWLYFNRCGQILCSWWQLYSIHRESGTFLSLSIFLILLN